MRDATLVKDALGVLGCVEGGGLELGFGLMDSGDLRLRLRESAAKA